MTAQVINLPPKKQGTGTLFTTHSSDCMCYKHTAQVLDVRSASRLLSTHKHKTDIFHTNTPTCWCSTAAKYACCSLCRNIRGRECNPADQSADFSLPVVNARFPFSLGYMKTDCCFSTSSRVWKSECESLCRSKKTCCQEPPSDLSAQVVPSDVRENLELRLPPAEISEAMEALRLRLAAGRNGYSVYHPPNPSLPVVLVQPPLTPPCLSVQFLPWCHAHSVLVIHLDMFRSTLRSPSWSQSIPVFACLYTKFDLCSHVSFSPSLSPVVSLFFFQTISFLSHSSFMPSLILFCSFPFNPQGENQKKCCLSKSRPT